MIAFLADENFNGHIYRALVRKNPDIDIVRVQDVGLSGEDDPTVLEWAATENRLLLTHDFETIPHFAYERVKQELPMPGVILCDTYIAISSAADDILLLAIASEESEWEGK